MLVLISRSRTILFERVVIVLITLAGVYFVLFPETSSNIAHLVGIGRGADLVFYLFIIFSLFWFSSISTKMNRTDRKLTEIVRANAVTNPVFGGKAGKEKKAVLPQ